MIRTPFLLVILLASHPAAASDEELAILELRFTAVPPTVSHQIHARVQNTLARGGYNVIPEAKVQSRLKRAAISPRLHRGPLPPADRRRARGAAGRCRRDRRTGTSYDITLTMLETSGGTVLAQVNQRCDVCNFKEVEEAAAVATERLHKQTLVFISTRSTLVLRSNPTRAEVLLDGLPAGKTPLRRLLPPGAHTYEVAAEGRSAVQAGALEPGKVKSIRVKLVPRLMGSATNRRTTPRSRRSPRWVKWAVLGTTVVAGGVGGGLLALDGRESSDPRYVHDTRGAGVTMIAWAPPRRWRPR